MARPFGTFKYRNVDELEKAIDKYFTDCDGKPVLDSEGYQITDKNGNPTFTPSEPYTLEGLADSLGISVRTLAYYGDKDYPTNTDNENESDTDRHGYLQTIDRARGKCLAYKAKRLYDKDGVQGAKFDLINNSERMGGLKYAERQEVDLNVQPITFVDDLTD